MQGSKDTEFGGGSADAGSRLLSAELRAFMLRATMQIDQAIYPLMDGLLGELQTRIERSRSNGERQQLSDAFVALHKRKPAIVAQFSRALRDFIDKDISQLSAGGKPTLGEVSFQGLSLMDDAQMAEEIEAKRIAMKIETAAEWELREVTALVSALQDLQELDQQRNPLRPELLSKALYHAMKSIGDDESTRRFLENFIGDGLAKAMPGCYQRIADELKKRNIQPLEYATRTSVGTGSLTGMDAGNTPARPLEQALLDEMTQEAQMQATLTLSQSLQNAISTVFGMLPQVSPQAADLNRGKYYGPGTGSSSRGYADGVDSGYDTVRGPNSFRNPISRSGPHSRSGSHANRGPDTAGGWSSSQGPSSWRSAHTRLTDLLMDLRGAVWGAPTDVRSVSVRHAKGFGDSGFADSVRNARSFASTESYRPSAFGAVAEGAMLNPVKAHLKQLQEATQEPYRMTIQVVAQIFDAILADTYLQPIASRLIARLQLPLLDVALSDANLFVRPDHPLHALVNRLGSAALAFDVYESGPGQRFYAAALTIVEEILEGDFMQLESYRLALDKLNTFVRHEAQIDNPFHADAARMLAMKEQGWQLEHHLSAQVTPVITSLPIPAFLREFFMQAWVRVQVEAVLRYGDKSPESHRFSRMCSDLLWSVLPKVTMDDKRQLAAALPHLMRDVNEAFSLLNWPAMAQKDFRSKLIEHQARAMKGDGAAVEDAALAADGGRAVIARLRALTVPSMEELQASMTGVHELDESQLVFTDVEHIVTGFMSGRAVLHAPSMDVPLFNEPAAPAATPKAAADAADELPSIDHEIALDKCHAMQAGDAYDIKIAGVWRKYRLAWTSELRGIYLFDDCKDVKSKLSLSAKTLMDLWQRDDIRLFEKQPLMNRAIEATRKQLLAAMP